MNDKKRDDKDKISEEEKKKIKDMNEEELQEEIDKLMKEFEEQTGKDPSNVKLMSVKFPMKSFKGIFLDIIRIVLFNTILILALSGLFVWSEYSIYELLYFALYFSGMEALSRTIIVLLFNKLIPKTFGIIFVVPTIVAIVFSMIFPCFVKVVSLWNMFFVLTLAILIRKFLNNYFFEKYFNRMMIKKGGNK